MSVTALTRGITAPTSIINSHAGMVDSVSTITVVTMTVITDIDITNVDTTGQIMSLGAFTDPTGLIDNTVITDLTAEGISYDESLEAKTTEFPMQLSKHFLAIVLTVMSFPVAVHAEQIMTEIDLANKAFAQAILGNDVDHLVNDYTEDACIIAPSTPKICGKEAIRTFWQTVIESKPKNVEIITLTAEKESGLAFATGDLRITDATGAVSENRFVLVFKKTADVWKLHIDSWTPK